MDDLGDEGKICCLGHNQIREAGVLNGLIVKGRRPTQIVQVFKSGRKFVLSDFQVSVNATLQ